MKKIKNVLRILVFVLLLACLLGRVSRVMEHKESILALKPFMDDAEEYDVLFLGDSQVRCGILPLELYNKYGIASYTLATGNCRLPMTYWKLLNALDYADPKLVVISAVDAHQPQLEPLKGEWLHVAFGGFPLSLTKARAILDLTRVEGEDASGVSYSDIRQELFFPLRKYHSRWNSLEQEDLAPVYNAQKGAIPRLHVSDPDIKAGSVSVDDCLPEEGYGYVYLRRIIEECQRREIPVVTFIPPFPARPDVHRGTHTSAKIAAEYGVPMLNFTDVDRIVDYYTDCADPGGHLNFSGALKMTDYMGEYLTSHYDLPDRRTDSAYAHWNDEWDAYVEEKIRVIAEDADSLRSRLMLLHDESFNVVLTVRPGFNYDARSTKRALQNIARAHVFDGDDLISGELEPLAGLGDAADFNQGYMMIVDRDAGEDYEPVHEFYGIGEQEFETSFGYVFCRMDGEWIDTSIMQGDTETYYFDDWDDQDQDMRLILIDRRTGKPALTMAFSRTEEETVE